MYFLNVLYSVGDCGVWKSGSQIVRSSERNQQRCLPFSHQQHFSRRRCCWLAFISRSLSKVRLQHSPPPPVGGKVKVQVWSSVSSVTGCINNVSGTDGRPVESRALISQVSMPSAVRIARESWTLCGCSLVNVPSIMHVRCYTIIDGLHWNPECFYYSCTYLRWNVMIGLRQTASCRALFS